MASNTSGKTGFTDAEREAMKERSRELALEKKADKKRADGEKQVQSAIDKMSGNDKAMAERIHELVGQHAPELWPKTWYGMPAYTRDGKVVCFYQPSAKFGARYATFGFDEAAKIDDGNMWATGFALLSLGPDEEKKIVELLKKAIQ